MMMHGPANVKYWMTSVQSEVEGLREHWMVNGTERSQTHKWEAMHNRSK